MTDECFDIEKHLFRGQGAPSDEPGKKTLFDQYKLFVDTMEKAVARRQTVNSFFLAANSILLSALGVMGKQAHTDKNALWVAVPLAAAGILLCILWRGIIGNYRVLNGAKFDVIHGLEHHLPAALFEAEWAVLTEGPASKKYTPISKTEGRVAIVFVVLYALAAIGAVGAAVIWWVNPGQ